MMKNYYYQILFRDGRIVRREGVTKKRAKLMHDAMVAEFDFFGVELAEFGVMK